MIEGAAGGDRLGTQSALSVELEARVRTQLEHWRKELIGIGRRDRLLYYKPTKVGSLEILAPGAAGVIRPLSESEDASFWFYFPEQAGDRILDTNSGRTQVPSLETSRVPADALLTDRRETKKLEAGLRRLEQSASSMFVDKGIWTLYLGAGFLHWADPATNEAVQSPLLLIPVEFRRERLKEQFRLFRAPYDAQINPALAVKLQQDFDLSLPSLDIVGEDLEELIRLVEKDICRKMGWSTSQKIVLDIFASHKESMYRDLQSREEELIENPLVQVLVLGPEAPGSESFSFDPIGDDRLDEVAPPEASNAVFDADASQRAAIEASKSGRTIVIDGPPGTGKSQTIANVIAELIGSGRSVLFVSEKAAALEVVERRLESAGLGEFLLPLYSAGVSRKEFAQTLARSLNTRPVARHVVSPGERERLAASRRLLSKSAAAVNEVRHPMGMSLGEAIGRHGLLTEVPSAPRLKGVDDGISSQTFHEITAAATALASAWAPVELDEFVWKSLRTRERSSTNKADCIAKLDSAKNAFPELRTQLDEFAELLELDIPGTAQEASNLLELAQVVADRPADLSPWFANAPSNEVPEVTSEFLGRLANWTQARDQATERAGVNWRNIPLGLASVFKEIRSSLSGLGISHENFDLTHTAELAETFTSLAALTSNAPGGLASLLAADHATPETMNQIASVVELLAQEPPVGTGWLTSLDSVRTAVDDLRSAAQSADELRESQKDVFTSSAVSLPLEELRQRFETYSALQRFGSTYRADKATLANVNPNRKFSRKQVEQLPTAVGWQTAEAKLVQVKASHSHLIGSHTNGRDSDWAAVEDTIRRAKLARDHSVALIDIQILDRWNSGTPATDRLSHAGVLRTTADEIARFHGRVAELCPRFAQRVWGLPLADASTDFGYAAEMLEQLKSGMSEIAAFVGSVPSVASTHEVEKTLARITAATSGEQALLQTAVEDAQRFGSTYQGLDTNPESVLQSKRWSDALRTTLGTNWSERSVSAALAVRLETNVLRARLQAWEATSKDLASLFDEPYQSEIRDELNRSFEDSARLLKFLTRNTSQIDDWAEHCSAVNKLEALGLSDQVRWCQANRVAGNHVTDVIRKAVLNAWIEAIRSSDSERLGSVHPATRLEQLEAFRLLDQRMKEAARAAIIESCSGRRPTTMVGGPAIVLRQAELKRKHMSVRALIEATGDLALRLRPCFLMNPLTVSQMLPQSVQFDAVIFDEASQVRPADAINALSRAKQLIVAGDQKQLPPMSFFGTGSTAADDEFDDESPADFESLLDLAKAAGSITTVPLRWHYRSQHEHLIVYSNRSFYEGRLNTFPGAVDDAADLGLELFRVNGVYARGGSRDNLIEAEFVVDRIIFHRQHHPKHSMGVVCFSTAQEDAVRQEIELRSAENPELELLFETDRSDGFFVKNLESVQGDERDIIIFSVGYGPDEIGKMTLNFGPLNRPGGERRLNVAITRARRRVEIICSFDGGQLVESASDGVRHLGRYLEFAKRGIEALAIDLTQSAGDAESPFEVDVLRVIRSWGYDATPQIGSAGYRVDIGVRDPKNVSKFVLGVECDGASYHSARNARDRDRLRQEVLEGLGWTIHRIWSTLWFHDREDQMRRLRAAIEAAVDGTSTKPDRSFKPNVVVTADIVDVEFDEIPKWVSEYIQFDVVAAKRRLASSDGLDVLFASIVAVEAPVQIERLFQIARDVMGLERLSSPRRLEYEANLAKAVRMGKFDRVGDFLWRNSDRSVVAREMRTDSQRPVAQVALRRSLRSYDVTPTRCCLLIRQSWCEQPQLFSGGSGQVRRYETLSKMRFGWPPKAALEFLLTKRTNQKSNPSMAGPTGSEPLVCCLRISL